MGRTHAASLAGPLPTVKSRPRILFITTCLDVGGTERHLLWLLPELSAAGYEVSLFVLKSGGALTGEFRDAGVPLYESARTEYKLIRLISAGYMLMRHLVSNRYDIVHCYLPAAYIVGSLCALVTTRAVRVMSRRSLNLYQNDKPLLRRVERALHPLMRRIVGNSEAVLSNLRDEEVDESQLVLIHNGVTIPAELTIEERQAIRLEQGLPENALVLVNVANLFSYKGHAEMLDALAIAAMDLPVDWQILFVGRDAGMGAELKARSKTLGLIDHVRWLGEHANPTPLLQVADIVMQCSYEEGFSNAVLEAMAAGKPAIVTATGGNTEAVIDGETGLLVPVGGAAATAEAIKTLASSAEFRSQLGISARERAIECFSQEQCLDGYLELYKGLFE